LIKPNKLCGPTSVGILYGKEAWLNKSPPYQCGGEMIKEVTFEEVDVLYNALLKAKMMIC